MSGHSKWANIRDRKRDQDAKRGKIFTKLIKEITVASKKEGSDPTANFRLRLAIQNAQGKNIPKETIERAIKKGHESDASNYIELTYEGYAPYGVALFIECATDNQNRTVSNVRSAFNRYGGNLSKNGSLEFLFDRKGVFHFNLPKNTKADELTLDLIDSGVEDIEIEKELVSVTCKMEDFGTLQNKLESLNIQPETAELQRIPNSIVKINNKQFNQVIKLIEKLEEDEDVQRVYHNLEI